MLGILQESGIGVTKECLVYFKRVGKEHLVYCVMYGSQDVS